jgi:hypothetical protein
VQRAGCLYWPPGFCMGVSSCHAVAWQHCPAPAAPQPPPAPGPAPHRPAVGDAAHWPRRYLPMASPVDHDLWQQDDEKRMNQTAHGNE